jgi:rare lipoprotein A
MLIRFLRIALVAGAVLALVGCFANLRPSSQTRAIEDGGPQDDIDVRHIPDAVPEDVDVTIAGNRTPYTVLGKTYHVKFDTKGYTETGKASWYGKKFHGKKTSNGETYDMFTMTAAHKTLAIPTYVRVTNLENQRTVVVRVNDRGPFHDGRIIDLSYAAAKKLDYHHKGTTRVKIEVLQPKQKLATVNAGAATQGNNTLAQFTNQTSVSQAPMPAKNGPQTAGPQTYLQAGSFSEEHNAKELQRQLTALTGHSVKVHKQPDLQLFKVLVGPITDGSQMLSLRQKLREANINSPYPVRL